MHSNINTLSTIANQSQRLIIGLMSGTSLDGLDIALCNIEGHGSSTKATVLQFETVAYSDEFKKELKSIAFNKNIELEKLCLLHPWMAKQHAGHINACLHKWGIHASEIDLIASHGQTIYHAPLIAHHKEKMGNATLQIGDGDHLAVATGIITISDFRQKHIAAGGEGAPLAVYGDILLFSKRGKDRILLNIGGIANFTWLPGNAADENIICTDVGPGNTMMDTFIQEQMPGQYYDKDAAIAGSGCINNDLLAALKENDFFKQGFPKTTGPELFNLQYLESAKQQSKTGPISVADTLATLNRFSADMITEAINICLPRRKKLEFFCSGGGIHNPLLMQHIKNEFEDCIFETTSALGIDPDAKEAVLFAVLANECICGDKEAFINLPAAMPKLSMGKISFPD